MPYRSPGFCRQDETLDSFTTVGVWSTVQPVLAPSNDDVLVVFSKVPGFPVASPTQSRSVFDSLNSKLWSGKAWLGLLSRCSAQRHQGRQALERRIPHGKESG